MAIGSKTYYLKEITHKGESYKFAKPLRVKIDNFLSQDLKNVYGELNVIDLIDGYTQSQPFPDDPMPDIRNFIKKFIDEVILPSPNTLKEGELEYRVRFIDLLKKPKNKDI